jgi:hypothetical protein
MITTSKNAALALTLAALLTGCSTYDYAQRTDQVAYSAGDAVRANLALQTIDPSKKSMNDTSDLGKDGNMPIVQVVVEDPVLGSSD